MSGGAAAAAADGAALVRAGVELQARERRRAASLRWGLLDAVLLAALVIDLWWKCPGQGQWSALHVAESVLAAALAASLMLHAARLLPSRAPLLTLTATQQRLLGLSDSLLDSSFRIVERSPRSAPSSLNASAASFEDTSALSLSLSRSWLSEESGGGGGGGGRGRGAVGGSPPRPAAPRRAAPPPPCEEDGEDCFIADSHSLTEYLRRYEARQPAAAAAAAAAEADAAAEAGAWSWGPVCGAGVSSPASVCASASAPAPRYQLATLDAAECSLSESCGGGGGGGEEAGGAVWRRLHVDPTKLTQYNLNLRLWLHMTIVSRVARARDSAAARPYLERLPARQYVAQRIAELAARPALSSFRWDRGGTDWDLSKPTDAEIILHLFATYMDEQARRVAGAGAGAGVVGSSPHGAGLFSQRHMSAPPAPPARHPRRLLLHRAETRPPHYLLLLGDETIEVCRGRNNLFYSMLVFLAAAARGGGGSLAGLQLGKAGLNLLWVIGR